MGHYTIVDLHVEVNRPMIFKHDRLITTPPILQRRLTLNYQFQWHTLLQHGCESESYRKFPRFLIACSRTILVLRVI